MKILVADDHKSIVDGIILDLNELLPNATITGAHRSSEIVELCNDTRFDIIFMDIDIPQANGIKLAKTVLDKYPRTNIIYITGYEKYALESYETNASTFLLKPVTKKAIAKAIDNLRFPVSDITDEMAAKEYSGKNSYPLLINSSKMAASRCSVRFASFCILIFPSCLKGLSVMGAVYSSLL